VRYPFDFPVTPAQRIHSPTVTMSALLIKVTSAPLRQFGHLHADGDRLSVTFSQCHKDLQLPDPRLLTLHAACARVAHMSGAAEAFNKLNAILKR
jgi:hypothetical protein